MPLEIFRRPDIIHIKTPLPSASSMFSPPQSPSPSQPSYKYILPLQTTSLLIPTNLYAKSNPNPFIQLLYLLTKSPHAAWGSLAVENNMHSSRAAFSSLHTQQGLGFAVAVSMALPEGLLEAARLLICWRESEAMMVLDWDWDCLVVWDLVLGREVAAYLLLGRTL
jgi:hypothetical protein